MDKKTLTSSDILVCGPCMEHYYAPENLMLPEACASVGIEHGKSTRQMLFEYMAAYHYRGHKPS